MSSVKQAQVIRVIGVSSLIGDGTPENPTRLIEEYFDLDGKPLAEHDDWAENRKASPDSEKFVKYDSVIRLLDEVQAWKLEDKWILDAESPVTPKRCHRCGDQKQTNNEKLCFECWDLLIRAKSLL